MTADTQLALRFREGDVYAFAYSQESWTQAKNGLGHGDLHWCFDGQLIVRNGLLCDTYWGLSWGGDNGRYFTPAEAQAKGELRFVCNLNETEKIPDYDFDLYDEADAFNLSHQHGCYKHHVKRIGAKKSAERMRKRLDTRIREARAEIDRGVRNLEYAIERKTLLIPRIEAGEEPSL